jgi:DNA-binding GntR family transcriptional regulator
MVVYMVFTSAMERPSGILGAVSTESSVADVLRRRILTGQLVVGDHLRQSDIAVELGVSTTPVREALRTLVAEGLVQIDTNKGAIIRRLTRAELVELLELQLVVEKVTLAAALPHIDLDMLAGARELHERMLGTSDPTEWALLNRDFHLLLSQPSGRTRTLRVLREVINVTTLQLRQDISAWDGRKQAGEFEHAELLEAVTAKDESRVMELLTSHLEVSIEHLREQEQE